MQSDEPQDRTTADRREYNLPRPTPSTAAGTEDKARVANARLHPVFVGTAIVLSVIFFFWLFGSFMPGCNSQVGNWINGRFNESKPKQPSVLDKLIEDRKSSQTLELEADRAEYEGRLQDAIELRAKAAQRRSEEQAKAASDKDFQEWRRKKYGFEAENERLLPPSHPR